jgi:hypothetical protein
MGQQNVFSSKQTGFGLLMSFISKTIGGEEWVIDDGFP